MSDLTYHSDRTYIPLNHNIIGGKLSIIYLRLRRGRKGEGEACGSRKVVYMYVEEKEIAEQGKKRS